jgi:hypothetical protein
MAEYQPQLKRTIGAIAILENTDLEFDEFCNALAELHVFTTVLPSPFSMQLT